MSLLSNCLKFWTASQPWLAKFQLRGKYFHLRTSLYSDTYLISQPSPELRLQAWPLWHVQNYDRTKQWGKVTKVSINIRTTGSYKHFMKWLEVRLTGQSIAFSTYCSGRVWFMVFCAMNPPSRDSPHSEHWVMRSGFPTNFVILTSLSWTLTGMPLSQWQCDDKCVILLSVQYLI